MKTPHFSIPDVTQVTRHDVNNREEFLTGVRYDTIACRHVYFAAVDYCYATT